MGVWNADSEEDSCQAKSLNPERTGAKKGPVGWVVHLGPLSLQGGTPHEGVAKAPFRYEL
jgi:hypothetical protein